MTAKANRSRLSYVKEVTWGITPVTPSMLNVRTRDGFSLENEAQAFISDERRTDLQVANARIGVAHCMARIPVALGYLANKDFIRALLRDDTTSGKFVSTAGTSNAFDAGTKTNTRVGGSWITDGAKVNMKARHTGSTSNDGSLTITAVTALVLTYAETIVTEAAGANVKINGDLAENGETDTSFTFEDAALDELLYDIATGMKISGMSIAVPDEGFITADFTAIGDAAASGAELDATPSEVDTNHEVDTLAATLEEAGAAIAIVTGANLQFANDYNVNRVVGGSAVLEGGAGRAEVTGDISVLFQNFALLTKFRAGTESALRIVGQDPAGNRLDIHLPRILFTSEGKSAEGQDTRVVNLNFQATRDATTGKTAIINMIPATAV